MLEAQTFCVVKSKEELKVRETVGREQQSNSQGLSSDNQTWLAGKSPIHRLCFIDGVSIYMGFSIAGFDSRRVEVELP